MTRASSKSNKPRRSRHPRWRAQMATMTWWTTLFWRLIFVAILTAGVSMVSWILGYPLPGPLTLAAWIAAKAKTLRP